METTQKVGAEAQTKADAAEGSLTAGVRSAKETVGRNPHNLGRARRHRGRYADVHRSRRRHAGGASRRRAASAGGHRAIEGTARESAEHRERVRNGAFQKRHRRGAAVVERRRPSPARPRHRERRRRSGRSGHQCGPRHGRGAAGRQQGAHQRPHCPGRSGRRRPGHRPSSLRSPGRQRAADYHDATPYARPRTTWLPRPTPWKPRRALWTRRRNRPPKLFAPQRPPSKTACCRTSRAAWIPWWKPAAPWKEPCAG